MKTIGLMNCTRSRALSNGLNFVRFSCYSISRHEEPYELDIWR